MAVNWLVTRDIRTTDEGLNYILVVCWYTSVATVRYHSLYHYFSKNVAAIVLEITKSYIDKHQQQ